MKIRILNVIVGVVFALAAFWLMAIDGANYLRKIESLSIFLPTHEFWADCSMLPGGALRWASLLLTQTFYLPWLGAAVYILLLLCIAGVAMRAFRLPRWAFAIVLIIPAAILKMLLGMGYVIFSLKTPGFAFMMPLGVLGALILLCIYTSFKTVRSRMVAALILFSPAYWLMGFYGLLAGTMAMVESLITFSPRNNWRNMQLYLSVLVTFLPSILYFRNVPNHLRIEEKFTVCLPWLYEGENLWTSYTDDNFRLTLDLDRALQDGDWQKALDAAAKAKHFEPTRLNVILTDMALLRAGKVPDELLKYRVGSAEYKTARHLRVTHDAGAMMFSFHTGHINYAYRWAMESKVEFGLNVEQLKMMVKCALLNGDYGVARKCLDNLSLTAFHKDWAKKYRRYADDPSLIKEDAELSAVKLLMRKQEGFIEDHGQLEGYIWKNLAFMQRGTDEQLELALVAAMISFNIDAFIDRISFYYHEKRQLPLYFQQAILFWSKHNENDFYRNFPIDPSLVEAYDRFEQAAQMYRQYGEDVQREQLRVQFGDTYWFYCYYMSGHMKII